MANLSDQARAEFKNNPDIAGLGIALSFTITSILSFIFFLVSFLGRYHGPALLRIISRQASFRQLGSSLLDQILITSMSLPIGIFAGSESSSAYTRTFVQICVSLSNISALVLFISIRGVAFRHFLSLVAMSLASFSFFLYNALDPNSVSTELSWLESGIQLSSGHNPFLVFLDTIAGEAVLLFIIGLRSYSEHKKKWSSDLSCLILSLVLITLHIYDLRELHGVYRKYSENDPQWSFGQSLPLVLPLMHIISVFQIYMDATHARRDLEGRFEETTTASQGSISWYLNIAGAIAVTRKAKVALFLSGAAAAFFIIIFLSQWYRGLRAPVMQPSRRAQRFSNIRNVLHYNLWSRSSGSEFAAVSTQLFRSWRQYTRGEKAPKGYREVRWKCSCGEDMAANFDNSDPHALKALENVLHNLNNPGTKEIPAQPEGAGSSSQISSFGSEGGQQRSHINQISARQPFGRSGSDASANGPGLGRQNAMHAGNSQRPKIPKYLELCVSVGTHSVQLGEINITSVATDGQLFAQIWENYRRIQGSSLAMTVRSWFFKPDDVFFVHFGVTKRHQVGIYGKPMEIPPPEEVANGRYHYYQCPMQPLPPMPAHIFLHYLDKARATTGSVSFNQIHTEDVFLDRLPKKLMSSIFATGPNIDATILYGWGIHIVERPSSFVQSMLGIVSSLICIAVFCVTWRCKDLNTAIGIGQFVAGVLALVNAAIYFALQAYSTRLSRRT